MSLFVMRVKVKDVVDRYVAKLVRLYPPAARHCRVEPWYGHEQIYLVGIMFRLRSAALFAASFSKRLLGDVKSSNDPYSSQTPIPVDSYPLSPLTAYDTTAIPRLDLLGSARSDHDSS